MFEFIKIWLAVIQQKHGVNPLIFGGLYLVCAVPFWFSIYKVIASIRNKKPRQIMIFGIILAIAVIIPYGYVAVFGRNLPAWFWILLGVIVLYSVWSIFKKINKSKKQPV